MIIFKINNFCTCMPYFVLSKQQNCFLAGLSLKIQFAGLMLLVGREFNSKKVLLVLYSVSTCFPYVAFFRKTHNNDNLLSVRKLTDS